MPQLRLGSAWASTQSHQSSMSAWRSLVSLAIHRAQSEDWSDWVDAQANRSLHLVHRPFCWFKLIVMLRLKWCVNIDSNHDIFCSKNQKAEENIKAKCYHTQLPCTNIRAASWQNQQSAMCTQRRLRSAWAFAQSDQSLRCPHEESLGP